MKIPNEPADIDLPWMNEALQPHLAGARVAQVRADYLSTPGQTADVIGVDVRYEGDCALPTRFVAKVAAKDPSTIENVVVPLDLYYKEYAFYRQGVEGIAYPRCFHGAFDRDTHAVVLLMEDISHLESPSWNPTPAQVDVAVDRLGPFHARWWNNDTLKSFDWLTSGSDPTLFGMYAELAQSAIPIVEDLTDDDMTDCHDMMRAFHDNLDDALRWVAGRPFTFVHGDYHPKQMFFGAQGSDDFVMIDWQLPTRSLGGNDLARIIVLGLDRETRRATEHDLIGRYHASLAAHGVDYPLEALLDDYRFGIMISLSIHYLAAATDLSRFIGEVTDLGLDWKDVGYGRLRDALVQHDCMGLVDQWR